jgi:hypothetical protein
MSYRVRTYVAINTSWKHLRITCVCTVCARCSTCIYLYHSLVYPAVPCLMICALGAHCVRVWRSFGGSIAYGWWSAFVPDSPDFLVIVGNVVAYRVTYLLLLPFLDFICRLQSTNFKKRACEIGINIWPPAFNHFSEGCQSAAGSFIRMITSLY